MSTARALALLTAVPAAVLLAAGGSAAASPPGPASALVRAQAEVPIAPEPGDPELDALWAAAVAEAEAMEREVVDGEEDTDFEPFLVDEDEQEDEGETPVMRAGTSKARSGRLASAKVAGAGARRRVVVTCARTSARSACGGTVRVRGAKGRVLKSWKVRVASGGTTVLAAPRTARSASVVRSS
jgi:hypothetical protein